MAGYSGTPLATKLGIKAGMEVYVIGCPVSYRELVEPLSEGVSFADELARNLGLVHVFTTSKAELAETLHSCRSCLGPQAVVWVSWPKKSAKIPTDISEDTVRELALPLGYVDIKVCAVTELWSGLKLVVRKELR
jgi:hypothetical protein